MTYYSHVPDRLFSIIYYPLPSSDPATINNNKTVMSSSVMVECRQECRSVKIPGYRNVGIPESQNTGMSEYRDVGIPESRESRNVGIPECWNTGMSEYRKVRIPECWSTEKSEYPSQNTGMSEYQNIRVAPYLIDALHVVKCLNEQSIDLRTDAQTHGRTDEWTDARTHGRTDEWTDARTHVCTLVREFERPV